MDDVDYLRRLSDLVRKRRLRLGFSASSLAKLAGVSPRTIANLEWGQLTNVDVYEFCQISSALSITPEPNGN